MAANRLQWQDEGLSLWVSQLYPWILRVGMASGCCTWGMQAQWVWDLGMGPIPVHQPQPLCQPRWCLGFPFLFIFAAYHLLDFAFI